MKYNSKEILETYNELGSYSAAAKRMGIDPRTVRKHVNDYHETDSFVASEATRTGTPITKVSHYWLKTRNEEGDDVSLFVKNAQEAMDYEELRDKLIKDLTSYSPKVEKIDRNTFDGDEFKNLLVIDPTDIHLGKVAVAVETGQDYNREIAFNRVYNGVQKILAKAEPFGIEQIVVVIGNDILHVDNTIKTTTKGTPQDTDGQWWQMFEDGRRLYVKIIELAKIYADVTIVYCPSNHDKVLGFGLADSIYSWYHNDENVNFSNYAKSTRHRKYIRYGANVIGFTHGDGAKNKDLTSLMQYDVRDHWAEAQYAYWYVHHMHHKYRIVNNVEVEKDNVGVTVIGATVARPNREMVTIECIRTPSPADAWHAQSGYVNDTAIEAFIHNYKDGQIARITSYC